jgi:hypothetical protein
MNSVIFDGIKLIFELLGTIQNEVERLAKDNLIINGFGYKKYEDVIEELSNLEVNENECSEEIAKRINYILEFLKQIIFNMKNLGE